MHVCFSFFKKFNKSKQYSQFSKIKRFNFEQNAPKIEQK